MTIHSTYPFTTPVKKTQNSIAKYAATIAPLAEVRKNMDSEMRKCFVGPMPVKEFLEKFLPVTPPSVPKNKLQGFEAMTDSGVENQMYEQFVSSFSFIMGIRHP